MNACELRESIKEVNETREVREGASLREASPGVVSRNEAMPGRIQKCKGLELFLGCEEPGNDGDLKLPEESQEGRFLTLFRQERRGWEGGRTGKRGRS